MSARKDHAGEERHVSLQPLSAEEALRALLATPPPPKDTPKPERKQRGKPKRDADKS